MSLVENIILRKRDGKQLQADELALFVQRVSDGSVSDAQIAAFTMATWFRGMTRDEERDLTLAMRDSGQVLKWPDLDGPVLDKHSTGGVGDLVSLVLGPLGRHSVGQRILVGVVVGLVFKLVSGITAHAGLVYGLAPWFGALLPTALVMVAGVWLMRREAV